MAPGRRFNHVGPEDLRRDGVHQQGLQSGAWSVDAGSHVVAILACLKAY
jgi:hypothetical protein